ncbi:hypothetical protein L479_02745 [Exiguobacterium sp. S17]|nr:hypothetical protein L479_02745 [Exiguobacterium sp. S17]
MEGRKRSPRQKHRDKVVKYKGKKEQYLTRKEGTQVVHLYIPHATHHETQQLVYQGWRRLSI